jgi:hypothetical protein
MSAERSSRLDRHEELETCSMLFAPTIEEHWEHYARLFCEGDRVLDVGAGDFSFVRTLRAKGLVAEGCSRRIRVPEAFDYNTLSLSESVGYLSALEFRALIRPSVRKIILKDFYALPGSATSVEETSYDWGFLRDVVIPTLICSWFRVEVGEFKPHRERWLGLLEKYGIPYVPYPHLRTVIVRAVREPVVEWPV